MSKIILIGRSGTGKSSIKNELIERNMRPEVSTTTRPMREGEKEGVDYYFIDKDEFEHLIRLDSFVQWNKLGENYYGTSKKNFSKSNLFIMSPNGIDQLLHRAQKNPNVMSKVAIIRITAPDEVREERMIRRGDDPEVAKSRMVSENHEWDAFDNRVKDGMYPNVITIDSASHSPKELAHTIDSIT